MSLELDDETREMLGYSSPQLGRAREGTDHYVSEATPSRIAPGQVDGRSRRNWRHRRAPESRVVAGKAPPVQNEESSHG